LSFSQKPKRVEVVHGRNYREWFTAEKCEERYNFLYTPDQLEPRKERIEEMSELTDKTFVIANNHYLGQAAVNATELKSMLSGKKVKSSQRIDGALSGVERIRGKLIARHVIAITGNNVPLGREPFLRRARFSHSFRASEMLNSRQSATIIQVL
jgi:hypothetical protein